MDWGNLRGSVISGVQDQGVETSTCLWGFGMQCREKLILSGLGNGSVSNCQYRHKELTSDPQNLCEKSDVMADL